MRQLVRSEDGNVTVWALIAIIPLVLILQATTAIPVVRFTVSWLEASLDRATKAAAWQIPVASYANGNPEIDPVEAERAFRQVLARNLRLEPETLEPLKPTGLLASVGADLEIYNGPFPQRIDDPEYDLAVELTAPAAVARITVRTNTYIQGQPVIIRKAAVAELYRRYQR